MNFSSRTFAIAVAALVVAALGYWVFGQYQQRETEKSAVALVTDAAERVRNALTVETGPPPANRTQVLKNLEESAAAVGGALQALKRLDAAGNRPLVDAADDYLLTTREILKKHAETQRHRLLWSESWQALREHMRRDNRTAAWVKEAVTARERAGRDFRSYSVAAEVLDKLLETLPASQKKIAPYVGQGILVGDDLLAKARGRVLEDAERAAANMEKTKQAGAFR